MLDLETRDLSEMKTVSGITVVFDPGKRDNQRRYQYYPASKLIPLKKPAGAGRPIS